MRRGARRGRHGEQSWVDDGQRAASEARTRQPNWAPGRLGEHIHFVVRHNSVLRPLFLVDTTYTLYLPPAYSVHIRMPFQLMLLYFPKQCASRLHGIPPPFPSPCLRQASSYRIPAHTNTHSVRNTRNHHGHALLRPVLRDRQKLGPIVLKQLRSTPPVA